VTMPDEFGCLVFCQGGAGDCRDLIGCFEAAQTTSGEFDGGFGLIARADMNVERRRGVKVADVLRRCGGWDS